MGLVLAILNARLATVIQAISSAFFGAGRNGGRNGGRNNLGGDIFNSWGIGQF